VGQRAAIYARVSTSDQSCERQLLDLAGFAERGQYEVFRTFRETASGTKSNRSARNQIMDLAQARMIDVVLVTELSRWGRSTQDLLDTLHRLAGWKVSVVAMSGMTFELDTPHGRMMVTLLAGIAQFERDLLSERVKSGLAAALATVQNPTSLRPKCWKQLRQAVAIDGLLAISASVRTPSPRSCAAIAQPQNCSP
jgi:putative DNA-invertase from lambdoid prophage Rac